MMNRCKCFLMAVFIISFSFFFSVIDLKAGTTGCNGDPVVDCVETVNPHGNTIPPAGSTTLPGSMGGQNEDGFYELFVICGDPIVELFVQDQGSLVVFGPFFDGDRIKYTEAPGATPSAKTIGSTTGQAGAIDVHIKGTGDMGVFGVDPAGGVSSLVFCLVPPPPK